jgi:hypothetical protein
MVPHNLPTKVPEFSLALLDRCVSDTQSRRNLQARAVPARRLPHDSSQDSFPYQDLPP